MRPRGIAQIAQSLGFTKLKVAAVEGDDVLDVVLRGAFRFEESGDDVAAYRDRIVSANAYLGAAPIVDALAAGADVVLTGRVADPSLFAAPLIHAFGWRMDDWDTLGAATVVGHLLECAGQVTGGYFADPGYKDVPNLARLGFPIGEVAADGTLVITKVPHAGGRERGDLQGTAALRDSRPGALSAARCRRGFHAGHRCRGDDRSRARDGRRRAARYAEGFGGLRRRLDR